MVRPSIDCAGLTDVGRKRANNEDHFLIGRLAKNLDICATSLSDEDCNDFEPDAEGELLIVADGMGGQAAGERASQLAVRAVTSYVLNMMPWFFRLHRDSEEDLIDDLKVSLLTAQDWLYYHAANEPRDSGLGTTLTLAYLVWPRAYVVHAGDSRCYLHRRGKLTRITQDQTVAQAYLDKGMISKDEAVTSPYRHILWNVVAGDSDKLLPTVYKLKLEAYDSLLLCTDGLTIHVSDEEIARVLDGPLPADDKCHLLVEMANMLGGHDNVTAVLMQVGAELEPEPFHNGRSLGSLDDTVVERPAPVSDSPGN